MGKSWSVSRTPMRALTVVRSLSRATSSYIRRITGHSTSRGSHWGSRRSLQNKQSNAVSTSVAQGLHLQILTLSRINKQLEEPLFVCQCISYSSNPCLLWILLYIQNIIKKQTCPSQVINSSVETDLAPRQTSSWNFPSLPMFLGVELIALT